MKPRSRTRLRLGLSVCALAFAGAGAWLFHPLHADLRKFDAVSVGDAEAMMWRHYYEPRHLLLALDLYRGARRGYGLSPFDSLRITGNAARAASAFHGNNDPDRHRAAEKHLRAYYRVIASHLGSLDAAEAARLELQWWREHRARQYDACARTLAALSATVYGGDPAGYPTSAKLRVEAMVLCDTGKPRLTEDGWASIRRLLVDSYRALHEEVNAREPGNAMHGEGARERLGSKNAQ